MKFLQIKEGVFIRKSAIECVEISPEGGCRIFTLSTSYESPYNYASVLELLEVEDIENQVSDMDVQVRGGNRSNPNLFGSGQTWVG